MGDAADDAERRADQEREDEGTGWPAEPPRLTPDELNELAINVVTNVTYITNTKSGLQDSFGLMLMGIAKDAPTSYLELCGAMYEDWHKAGPRSINGKPFFFSGKVLHRDDLKPLYNLVEVKQAALA